MGGQLSEKSLLLIQFPANTSHGPTIRFATAIQSTTNAATGTQFVIGTNGRGTFPDIGHASIAARNKQRSAAGIANYDGNV